MHLFSANLLSVIMAPTKKEKTKNDLDDALFKFHDKKEELDELLSEAEEAEQPLDRALVNSTLIELVDKWETVVTCYMNFGKARCDDEDEKEAMKECTTRYKYLRKQFIETKRSVAKAVDKQTTPVLPVHEEVMEDQSELIQDELQATAYARQVLEEEVGLVEQEIASLPMNLSREIIANQRIKPDQISAQMETRLKLHLQRQIGLEPERRDELQRDHRAFIRSQMVKLGQILSALFVKQAKAPAEAPISTSSPQARAKPRLQLEKLKVPTFDGDHTKWLLFKSKFEDIVVAGAGHDDTAQGHILREVVPKEAQERIEHVKLASEMMSILDKIFGDPATSVSIIVNKLLNLALKNAPEYDQVIELCDIINRHCVILASLSTDAANHVKYNTNLLSHLIGLLPGSYEDKWYDHITSQAVILNKWDIFTTWLKKMERRANAQKLDNLHTLDKKATTCSKCKSVAHTTANHPKLNSHATGVQANATLCPVCGVFHERQGVKGNIIIDCIKWRELQTVNEKAKLVEKMSGCKRCLRWDHQAGSECLGDKGYSLVKEKIAKHGAYICGKLLANGVKCPADHSPYLCGTNVEYCCLTRLTLYPGSVMPNPMLDPIVLLPIQEVKVDNQVCATVLG